MSGFTEIKRCQENQMRNVLTRLRKLMRRKYNNDTQFDERNKNINLQISYVYGKIGSQY